MLPALVVLLGLCGVGEMLPAAGRKKAGGRCVDPLGGRRHIGEEWVHDKKFARRCVETSNGWRIETFECILPSGEHLQIGEHKHGASCERDEYGVTKMSLPFTTSCGTHENGEKWDEEEFQKQCEYGSIRPVGCYSRQHQLIQPGAQVTENNVTYKCVETPKGLAIATDSIMKL